MGHRPGQNGIRGEESLLWEKQQQEKENEGWELGEEERDPVKEEETWRASVVEWGNLLDKSKQWSKEEVMSIFIQAFEKCSVTLGTEEACRWAGGFEIPEKAVQEDKERWRKCGGSLSALASHKISLVAEERFSTTRVRDSISTDNPERQRLFSLAKGQLQYLSPDFTGCTVESRPPLGHMFKRAAPAVEKMFFGFWEMGLAVLLTEEEVREIPNLGLCLASWAPKQGKEKGRPITNGRGARGLDENMFPNSPYTKEKAKEVWGAIRLPVIGDVPRMILELEEQLRGQGCEGEKLVLWKFDLAAAYTLVSYHPDMVSGIGVELREGRFMFFLGGVFGLTGMPFAFDVVSRAIRFEVTKILGGDGKALVYCDDGLVVSRASLVAQHQEAVMNFIVALLGPKAIAEDKSEKGTVLTFIGYEIDLTGRFVAISTHNLLKALYAFTVVDLSEGASVPVKLLQVASSLASRYAAICSLMKPWVSILYGAFKGRNEMTHTTISEQVRATIRLFRALLVAQHLRKADWARPFSSFTRNKPYRWVVEFDASLTGIGIIWWKIGPCGREICMAYASIDISWMGFDKSNFQNTVEYLALLLGFRGLIQLGGGGEPTRARGDSKTALSWAEKGRPKKSEHARRAGVVWTVMALKGQIDITCTEHISGTNNALTDCLSRHEGWAKVLEINRRLHNRCGFVFPMIAVGAMCGAVAYQQYDYLPLGLCVGCFLAGVPAGICPMPFTLVGIPIYILYFGLYQTIPIFICVITSYTVVCGSGLFKTLADRGKPPDEGVVGGPGSMSSNISGANTGIAGQKDSEASLRESLMRKTEEEEYAANRYTNKNSNKGSVL